MAKKIIPFIVLFGFIYWLYGHFLYIYFTGDDFFHFKASQANSVREFLRFFAFLPFSEKGYAFYRPLFREVLYFSFYNLFGLDQLPFRIFQLLLHLGNTLLVFMLARKLFNKNLISYLAAFIFGVSSANVGALYYLAGGIQAQGATLFMLGSILLFASKRKFLSFLAFLLALGSHEMAVVTPALLAGLLWVQERNFKKFTLSALKNLWPHTATVLAYLYLNVFVIGFSSSEVQYQPNFGLKTMVNTLSWYLAWSVGLPEMVVDYLGPKMKLNPNLMENWGNYFKVIFPAFFLTVTLIVVQFLIVLAKTRQTVRNKKFLFLILWFPVALLPVLFLPIHKKTYYLQSALPAFALVVGYLSFWFLEVTNGKIWSKLFIFLFVAIFSTLTIYTVRVSKLSYWAAKRAAVSEKLMEDIKKQYPSLPSGSVIFVKNDPNYPFIADDWGGTSTQAYFALNGSDAFQLLYRDPALQVIFEDRVDFPPGDAIFFTAKI